MKKYRLFAFFVSSLLVFSSCGSKPISSSSSQPEIDYVEDKTISITWNSWDGAGKEVSEITREGIYTGELSNGIPNGEGTFSSVNDSGVSWTYTGSFKNGKFDGQGETIWEESQEFQSGTYTDGLFTPTTCELFVSIASMFSIPYTISDKNQVFMENNTDIFPVNTETAQNKLSDLIQVDLTYPMMTKTLEGLEGQLYQCNIALAGQVFQSSMYGHTVTSIIAMDEDNNHYVILYDGALPDVYDNTYISFTALPVTSSGYSNVSGGTTNAIVMIGAVVTVLET